VRSRNESVKTKNKNTMEKCRSDPKETRSNAITDPRCDVKIRISTKQLEGRPFCLFDLDFALASGNEWPRIACRFKRARANFRTTRSLATKMRVHV